MFISFLLVCLLPVVLLVGTLVADQVRANRFWQSHYFCTRCLRCKTCKGHQFVATPSYL